MPNWCNNTVEINHPDPAKLKELVTAINEGKFCSYAIPVPADLSIVAGRVGSDEDQAQKDLVAKEEVNLAKFGYKNWYDFCVNEWGTKWDVDPYEAIELEEGATDVTFGFDSAWAPPIGCYGALVEQGFEVRAYYYEPGMAFAGLWDNGDDDFYEIGGMTSEQVADELPSALDKMFGISEYIAEWEEENAEEESE